MVLPRRGSSWSLGDGEVVFGSAYIIYSSSFRLPLLFFSISISPKKNKGGRNESAAAKWSPCFRRQLPKAMPCPPCRGKPQEGCGCPDLGAPASLQGSSAPPCRGSSWSSGDGEVVFGSVYIFYPSSHRLPLLFFSISISPERKKGQRHQRASTIGSPCYRRRLPKAMPCPLVHRACAMLVHRAYPCMSPLCPIPQMPCLGLLCPPPMPLCNTMAHLSANNLAEVI